ncbi:hypothetical protein AVEN_79421-1 [Araneus ventricosus]|uniref:Uncharacterized protein n=1 Tax=Araneus ventricosus TaxID=182803 RepID=A0A4Y2WA09_ARAVE|nr:hypothetical protein AVEN_79421-1 [Araneus ventricosus]
MMRNGPKFDASEFVTVQNLFPSTHREMLHIREMSKNLDADSSTKGSTKNLYSPPHRECSHMIGNGQSLDADSGDQRKLSKPFIFQSTS